MHLHAIGFCGVDESVDCQKLRDISNAYPWVEWGILFRPEKESTPRFPSMEFVKTLSREKGTLKLAAHLCSSRCQSVLDGDFEFVSQLEALGFKRVQINATAANGVDTSYLATAAQQVLNCIQAFPQLEFIIQKNNETRPIWEAILETRPSNVSILFDESVGTGIRVIRFASPFEGVPCGYAGGIGPSTIVDILESLKKQVGEEFINSTHRAPWIDMESSLRTITDTSDIFDIDKVQLCIDQIKEIVLF